MNIVSLQKKGKTVTELREVILKYLQPVCPSDPWCTLENLEECAREVVGLKSAEDDELEAFEKAFEDELSKLIDEGLVTTDSDARLGTIHALVTALAHPEYREVLKEKAAYEAKRDATIAAARAAGYSPKWNHDLSWHIRHDGELLVSGGIDAVADFLDAQKAA